MGNDPSSDEHVTAIQQWLDSCLNNAAHKVCNEKVSGAEAFDATDVALPTRCIEITRKNLVLRETKGDRGAYDASKMSRTTLENYQLRQRRLDFDDLPKTFRDAIIITQASGCRYLWVDSVCIIQEGTVEETERMKHFIWRIIIKGWW